jgi:sulfopyruvate decarboxylase TPP-binding subunit
VRATHEEEALAIVELAATYAEEASSPFALLLSREDIQW